MARPASATWSPASTRWATPSIRSASCRARAASTRADTEYLARELASLRVSVGELATRDFIRSELNRLTVDDGGDEAERREKKAKKKRDPVA